MASSKTRSTFELGESNSSGGNKVFKTFRSLPKSWIIIAVTFYCVSLITVGLLAGLLPRRTQHISVLATPTQITTSIITSTTTATISPSVTTTTTHDPSKCIDDECNPRLSTDLIVHSYELEYMYNNTMQTTVPGRVTIDFTLKKPVKQIIYHSKRMVKLEEPALFEDNVYQFVSMRIYAPNDYITLRLSSNSLFASNRYRLVQKFTVNVTDGNTGFYQNIFNDINETTGKLLATKFEPTDARKAFPCFDEPHLKATFKISIIHPENTIALANFPIEEETTQNGLRHTTFEETFRMSTYLAAWAILPDTYGQKLDNDDESMITVWARREPTDRNHTALALEIASNSVTFFVEYFQIRDPVSTKIDLLTIPDFSTGGMENWGLISFREDRILFDEKIASTYEKQHLGETVAHELAHFWFGNYVTCKWWDDLWLNEAMATWLSYKPFTKNYPDWNMELQMLTGNVIPAMWDDAKPSSHPIVVKNVTNAVEIISLFDSITYSKGASILRMLEKFVGSDTFRDGLQDYLKINAFDVGDPSVFYNKLFSNMSGEEFMKNWLEERNYPLLNVNLKIENGNTKVVFTQSRFIISNVLNSSYLDKDYRWKINVQCILGSNSSDTNTESSASESLGFLLDKEQDTKIISGKIYGWIKCNQNFQGFYVTEYTFQSNPWQHFSSILELQPQLFSDEDKVNLIQDAFLLAYKGSIDYSEPLRILNSMRKNTMKQFVHWRAFQWHWETLADLIDYLPDTLINFQKFAIQQILSDSTTLDTIVSINSNDDHNTKLVKGLQFALLCRMNHTNAIEKASTLFRLIPPGYFNNENINTNVGADFLSTVYTYHLKNNYNDADWNMLYTYYTKAISPQEQTRALIAISSINNRNRLNQLLNEGLTGGSNTIKRQDYFHMMDYMTRHPFGRDTVWSFYKDNYEKLVDTFTLENERFGTIILSIARSFDKASYLQEMNELFTKYPNAGAGTAARKQAIDQVTMNLEWIKSREQNLRDGLATISQS